MNDTVSVTARISIEDKEKLEKLASATGRTKAFLISKAIQEYLDHQSWQVQEIQKAVEEAEAGEFAGDDEVGAFFARWNI